MSLSKSFILAWRAWLHAPAPYSNAYRNGRQGPCYDVELALDHMESQLYMVGQNIIAGQRIDLTNIEDHELAEVTRLGEALDRCAIPDIRQQALQAHIALVRTLWEKIQRLPSDNVERKQ